MPMRAQVRSHPFRGGGAVPLSDALPMLENMGLRVTEERQNVVARQTRGHVWLHDFKLTHNLGDSLVFDAELRALSHATSSSARQLLADGRTPAPSYEARKCTSCSLLQMCLPQRLNRATRVDRWLASRLEE